ncbi:major facilitator superfamily domain-containing protein 6-like [Cheilinus undulatus]|uniref:major facilitator superfamily domain-containing protein 6-like n=1 Tax=Cheilinus undulatus TaxID=241271 RepID=UPI001BD6500C|nr:major facilitator superfamily domain-containing protein 6-like [Cheilinus undulatus]
MRRNKQIDVKRALALSGALNFLVFCARACLLPFLTLFFRQLGLTPAMTGVVMGTKHLITLVGSPVGSLLAKHYNKRRVVLICSLLFSAAVPLILLLVPSTGVYQQMDVCNTSDITTSTAKILTSSVKPTTVSARTRPETTTAVAPRTNVTHMQQVNATSAKNTNKAELMTSISVTKHAPNSSMAPVRKKRSDLERRGMMASGSRFEFLGSLKVMDPQHQLFFLVLITVSVWESASAPLEWTADDGLYEYLDFADASDRYSTTGMWSLLGAAWGVGGAGLLVSQTHCLITDQTTRSALYFYCHAAVVALTLPVAVFLPLHLNKKRDKANGLLKAAQLVRGSPRALLCAATAFLVGAASSAVDNFLLWQMQDHGSDELYMGAALAIALLSQAAFPLLAGKVSRLLAPGRVLAVGAAVLSLQCLYYSFLWAPWAALPAQLFSCLGAGAVWWAVRLQCEDVSTPGIERSVRRIYGAFCLHLGSGLGSLASGFVVQRFGLAWLFRGVAVCLMGWCVCLPLLQWKAPRQRRINYSRLLAADASEGSDSESEQERDWLDKAMENERSNNNYGRRVNQ